MVLSVQFVHALIVFTILCCLVDGKKIKKSLEITNFENPSSNPLQRLKSRLLKTISAYTESTD